jgi:hypothetical protein
MALMPMFSGRDDMSIAFARSDGDCMLLVRTFTRDGLKARRSGRSRVDARRSAVVQEKRRDYEMLLY